MRSSRQYVSLDRVVAQAVHLDKLTLWRDGREVATSHMDSFSHLIRRVARTGPNSRLHTLFRSSIQIRAVDLVLLELKH